MQQNQEQEKVSDLKQLNLQRHQFSQEIRQNERDQFIQDIRMQKTKKQQQSQSNGNPELNMESSNIQQQVNNEETQGEKVVYNSSSLAGVGLTNSEEHMKLKNFIDQCLSQQFVLEQLPQLVAAINSNDIYQVHLGVIGIRKILSVDSPPIQPIIDSNLVPILITFMKQDEHIHLQLEAAWALTNVASGTSQQTSTIIDKGGIPLFVKLLHSPYPQVAEQAIWAIGNIAGDSYVYRDMIIQAKAIDPLVAIIHKNYNKVMLAQAVWALSNLCRGKPLPSFELVKGAIPAFAHVISQTQSIEVYTDACWAISYLTDGKEQRNKYLIESNCIQPLIKLLGHPIISIIIPVIRVLGNVVTGSDSETQIVIQNSGLEALFQLLNHEKRAVVREVLWTISNITAGNQEQIKCVVQNENFMKQLMTLAASNFADTKREAAWVLSNATKNGAPEDVLALVSKYNLIGVFYEALQQSTDEKTIGISLEGIYNILKCGQMHFLQNGTNPFLVMVEQFGMVKKIEQLQEHISEEIYHKSIRILEEFFDLEDPI